MFLSLNDNNNNKRKQLMIQFIKLKTFGGPLPTIESRSICSKLSSYLNIVRNMRISEQSSSCESTATNHKEKYSIAFDIFSCRVDSEYMTEKNVIVQIFLY